MKYTTPARDQQYAARVLLDFCANTWEIMDKYYQESTSEDDLYSYMSRYLRDTMHMLENRRESLDTLIKKKSGGKK